MTIRNHINGATVFLLAAIITLASTSIYCARALNLERQRAAQTSAVPALLPQAGAVRTESLSDELVLPPAPSLQASHLGATEWRPLNVPAERDAGSIAVARDRLARLADPQARAEIARRMTDDARRGLDDLVGPLGLAPAEVDRVVDAATGLAMQGQQRVLECSVDPACDTRSLEVSLNKSMQEQILQLMGPEKRARLQAVVESSDERFSLDRLRERLPAGSRLTDENAGELIQAVYEERRRLEREAEQAGEKAEEYRSATSAVALRSAARPGSAREYADRMASATTYNARVIGRAARLLDGEALARFRESQELALESYRRLLREKEVADAARRAADKP